MNMEEFSERIVIGGDLDAANKIFKEHDARAAEHRKANAVTVGLATNGAAMDPGWDERIPNQEPMGFKRYIAEP